jgi:hypothetical protein
MLTCCTIDVTITTTTNSNTVTGDLIALTGPELKLSVWRN